MNPIPASWRTDDPCPCCGYALRATDDGQPEIRLDCGLCGWSSTWTGDHGTEVSQ
jgi:ribosomal protein S27AE